MRPDVVAARCATRGRLSAALFVVAGCLSCVAAAEQPAPHVYRFADLTLDLDDGASIAEAFKLPVGSPSIEHLRALLLALAVSRTVRPTLDAATDPAKPWAFGSTYARVNLIAADVFIHGLRRVDDATLLAARSLADKVSEASKVKRCSGDATASGGGFRLDAKEFSAGEAIRLLDALTRATEAINARNGIVPIDDPQLQEALMASMQTLTAEELLDLPTHALEPSDPRNCRALRVVDTLMFRGPPDGAALLLRSVVTQFANERLAVRVYSAGDALQCPLEGLMSRVNGRQLVRLVVDPEGHVRNVSVIEQQFTPEIIARADGSEIAANDLYQREIVSYMKTKTYPPRIKDGQPVETIFELPIKWTIAD